MELCLKQLVRKILTIPRSVDAQVTAGKAVGAGTVRSDSRPCIPSRDTAHPTHPTARCLKSLGSFIRDVLGNKLLLPHSSFHMPIRRNL